MTNIDIAVERPYLFFILIPALVLGIIPFLRLQKKRRTSTKHLIPFIVHLALIFLLSGLLAGITVTETNDEKLETKVVFVADVSDSNIHTKSEMNEYIETVVKAADNDTKFAVVMFADSVIETVDSDAFDKHSLDYLKFTNDEGVKTDKTDIEEAISAAAALFGEPDSSEYLTLNKKIVVLSDGLETIGNGLAAVKQLDEGIQLTGAHFNMVKDGTDNREVQLVSINTTGKVAEGADVTVELVVKSTKFARNVHFVIYDGEEKEEFYKDVQPGENVFKYTYTPEVAGVNTIRATMEFDKNSKSDLISGNNTLYAWYTLEAQKTILIVDGDKDNPEEAGQFSQIAASEVINRWGEYAVYGPISPTDFPNNLEDLLKYDQIALMDVDFGDLPETAGKNIKRYVEEVGRGVFVSFGDNFYDIEAEDYVDTPIEEILPVNLKLGEERETVAMVLVVDLSSSMKEILGSNQSRFEVVVESVKKVLMLGTEEEDAELGRGFKDSDYVGIVCFDQGSHVALDIQQLGDKANRESICEIVEYELRHYYYAYYLDAEGNESDIPIYPADGDKWTSQGYTRPEGYDRGQTDKQTGQYIKSYGTNYKWAVQAASDMLASKGNETILHIKQVLFMSDGAPGDIGSGYIGIIERMAKAGIQTSAISVGATNTSSDQYKELLNMSEAGGGTIFVATTADSLTTEIITKAEEITPDLVNNREVLPYRTSYNSSILQGVRDYEIIGGYYSSEIKPEADAILCVEKVLQRPLYAEWTYGLGKVSVFMSDLGKTEWTRGMFQEEHGVQLIANMFNATMNRQVGSTGIEYSATRNESTTNVVATVPKTVRDGELLMAIVYDQNDKVVEEVTFSSVTEKKYNATLHTSDTDETYKIELAIVDQNARKRCDTTTFAVTGYYNPEFDVFTEGGEAYMMGLVTDGSGELLGEEGLSQFFDDVDHKIIVQNHDVMLPATIAALLLFLLDIVFRNIVVKRKKEKKKEMSDEERMASMRGR